ncbi:MAG: transcriptional regulator [Polaromonas sp.]|nr:MAG: transcriptional regulator [Polaromonas sp.]
MITSHPVVDIDTLRSAATQAVAALKLLANEDRLILLCKLSQGEMCVSELEEQLSIRQPTLSQQLGVLRYEGVVSTRRQGKNIYYSVVEPAVLEILAVLYRLYCNNDDHNHSDHCNDSARKRTS